MIDIETLGTTPGSVILSIGAVGFDPTTGQQDAGVHILIDPANAQAAGLTIDASTVDFWLTQSQAARDALRTGLRVSLAAGLETLSAYWRAQGGEFFWAHGPDFDGVLLSAAYRAVERTAPWRYSKARCTRTIYAASGVSPDRAAGTHHSALDDARSQADAVHRAYLALGLAKPPQAENAATPASA